VRAAPKIVLERHNVRVIGDTGPTVVLAHGFGTTQASWNHVIDALPGDARLVLFDLIGMSAATDQHYAVSDYPDLWAYARDLLAILAAAGIERCHYVGHSVSGMIGLLASIRDPSRFEKLILIGASPCYRSLEGYPGGFEQSTISAMVTAMAGDYSAWVESFAPAVAAAPRGDPTTDDFVNCLRSMRPDVALSVALTIFGSDHRAHLPLARTPCVVAQTRQDMAVPMAVAAFLRDTLPDAVLEVIDAHGHLPHMAAPDQVAALLRRHLALDRGPHPAAEPPQRS